MFYRRPGADSDLRGSAGAIWADRGTDYEWPNSRRRWSGEYRFPCNPEVVLTWRAVHLSKDDKRACVVCVDLDAKMKPCIDTGQYDML